MQTVGLVLGVCFVTWLPFLILNIVSCYNLTTECTRGDSKRPIPVARTWVKATALTLSAARSPADLQQFPDLFLDFCGCFAPTSHES